MSKKPSFSSILDYFIAFLIGAIISIMVVFNTELGHRTTNEVSIAINQIVGIVVLSAVMLLGRKSPQINPKRQQSEWWQWFGGIIGLGVLTINYYSVSNAGTTISMAAAVLGQCFIGLVYDITGWMGMEKREITRRKILSFLLSLLGILIMLFWPNDRTNMRVVLFGLLGILAGVLTMVQMVYNSGFAKKKGPFFSARQNVISGLCGIVVFMLIFKPSASVEGFKSLASVPFATIVGGGTLGCIIVVGTNIIIPRIPAAASSILLSTGQIIMAVILDYAMYGIFEPALLLGSIVMLIGIIIEK